MQDIRQMEQHFLAMYEQHADSVYRYCLMKLSDPEAAADTVQDTFMRHWDTMRKGDAIGNDRALLFTIARRLIIDRYRVKGRTTSLDALAETVGFDPPDPAAADPAALSDGSRVLALLRKLPPAYHDALHLRFVEGLEPREIAHVLGESANAVTVRIHRGLAKLRQLAHTDL